MIRPGRPLIEAPGHDVVNVPPLGRRVFRLRNVVPFLLALVILYLVYRELLGLDWRETWAQMRGVNAGLLLLALTVFYCSFAARALRWQALLDNVGYSRATSQAMPAIAGLTKVMYLGWFANCITIARLGDVYRGYLLKRSAGVSLAVTLGTVLAERLLDLTVLAAMLSATVLVAFHGSLPLEVTVALVAGLVLSGVGIIGLLLMRHLRWLIERVLPKRMHAHYGRFEHGTIASFRRVPLLVAYSAVGWAVEGATLYLTAAAVGTPVSVTGALVVALVASLLTTVPFTPAGLGFAEAGIVIMLQWLGLDAASAGAATLLFRLITYWSIVVLGFVLYGLSRGGERLGEERLTTYA